MSNAIARPALLAAVQAALARSPAVAMLGARQVGKTTLARHFVSPGSSHYLDLEDPAVQAQLAEPMTLLGALRGLVVIDEVQRAPEIFPVLRVLIDRVDTARATSSYAALRRHRHRRVALAGGRHASGRPVVVAERLSTRVPRPRLRCPYWPSTKAWMRRPCGQGTMNS